MRRASALAIALVLTFATGAGAAAKSASVTGDFSYLLFDRTYEVSLGAHAADPPTGVVDFVGPFGMWFKGTVSCVSIEGSDAWVAGSRTASNSGMDVFPGFVVRLHDGGTPGSAGDMAVMLFYFELDDAMKICEKTSRQIDRLFLSPLTEGNLVIH